MNPFQLAIYQMLMADIDINQQSRMDNNNQKIMECVPWLTVKGAEAQTTLSQHKDSVLKG